MSNTYIKFKCPDSKVKKVPENIGKRLAKVVLESIVPIANPDFEKKIDKVVFVVNRIRKWQLLPKQRDRVR